MKGIFSLFKSINWHNIITGLIIFCFLLIAAIIVSGGIDGQIGSVNISIHGLRNPSRFLLLLIILKMWMHGEQSRKALYQKAEHLLGKKSVLFALFMLALILFIWMKIAQHYTFRTGAYDLSMYDDALSNTLKGQFMYTRWLGRNYFSEHFAPILLLIAPFYWLHDGPMTLLVFQAIGGVLAAIPLYALAKRHFSESVVGICIVIAYFNYKYFLNGMMFDFHHEIFVPAGLFAAFYFLQKNAALPYFIILFLALACKEDLPIYLFMLGAYACVVERNLRLGIPTMVICVIWAVIVWKFVIPMSDSAGPQASRFLVRWSKYGDTYTQIAWNIFTHPWDSLGKLFLKNMKNLLSPLGFVPLTSPSAFLLAIPPTMLNITSEFDMQQNLRAHYALPIIPFLFIALILGLKNICQKFPQRRRMILSVCCVWLLVLNVGNMQFYPITAHDVTGHDIIQRLPERGTISAQTSLIPHLSHSLNVSILPNGRDAQYLFFDTQRFTWPLSDTEYQRLLQEVINDQNYSLLVNREGFYLFEKIATDH